MARWRILGAALLLAVACKRAPPPATAGACDSVATCMAVAEERLRAPSSDTETEIIAALGKACDLRSGEACLRLSHFLALHGAERGPVNALVDKACEAGHAAACLTAGTALVDGLRGRTRDLSRGRALLEKACRGGETAACARLAEWSVPDAGAARKATSR